MKLLLLAHSTLAHLTGGVETHVDALGRAAAALGHDVELLTTAHPRGLAEEVRDGVRIEYLAGTRPALRGRDWRAASVAAVGRRAAGGAGDLLLSFNDAGAAVARARIGPAHWVVMYGRTLGHLVSEWHDRAGLAGLVTYPRRALALVYHAVGEARLLARVDGVVATCDRLRADLARRRGLRVVLAYNGTDPRVFRPDPARRATVRRTLGIPGAAPVLLLAATVNRQKGIWVGVEAFARLAARRPDLYLLVAGDGPDRARLEASLRGRTEGDRARFVGAAPLGAMPGYFAAADLLLYPTFRAEGLPTAIVEALACGVPAVASDRGGVASAVRDGETGVLLPSPSVAAVAAATAALLDDRARRAALGRRGVELARATFDTRRIVARLLPELASAAGVSRAAH